MAVLLNYNFLNRIMASIYDRIKISLIVKTLNYKACKVETENNALRHSDRGINNEGNE